MSFASGGRLYDVIPTSRRLQMSTTTSKLNLTQVGRVCVTVADTDRAIDFYVGTVVVVWLVNWAGHAFVDRTVRR